MVAASILKALKAILSVQICQACQVARHSLVNSALICLVKSLVSVQDRMLSQLPVLPVGTEIEAASLANALSLRDDVHEISQVEGYKDHWPSKKKPKLKGACQV